MDPSKLVLGPLRVSTMVVTAHLGTTLNLHRLLELFHEVAIPLTWPDEGFLKVEYKPCLLYTSEAPDELNSSHQCCPVPKAK